MGFRPAACGPVALALVVCTNLFVLTRTASALTIDRVNVNTYYASPFNASNPSLEIPSSVPGALYVLSDGSGWSSGAGSYATYSLTGRPSVTTDGSTVRYTFDLPIGSPIYYRIDYDSGDHSSQGTLVSTAPLVLTATINSGVATLSGYARVQDNSATWYGEPRFNYFTAPVNSRVPFTISYTLSGSTWTTSTFSSNFNYSASGAYYMANFIIPEPSSAALGLAGTAIVLRRRRLRVRVTPPSAPAPAPTPPPAASR